ncbi:hypothetical protein NSQ14_12650 [Caldifermentibacillus hisashii]|uniref:hypothetical protein n=1 Tax=Caldifermentibacillus hisashii TaxID=996558 RepID=UPI0031FD99A1
MEFIENNIISYLVPIGAFIKVLVDNWNSTDLERKLMSNFKKFQIGLAKYILVGVSFVAYFYLIVLPLSLDSSKVADVPLVRFLSMLFIIFASLYFLLEKLFFFAINIFKFKFDYYIVNEDNEPDLLVIKSSAKNLLLVKSKENIEEFIDNPKSKRYKKVRREKVWLSNFYQGRIVKVSLFLFFILSVISFIVFLNIHSSLQFIFYLFSVLFLVLFIVILIDFKSEKKFQKEHQK